MELTNKYKLLGTGQTVEMYSSNKKSFTHKPKSDSSIYPYYLIYMDNDGKLTMATVKLGKFWISTENSVMSKVKLNKT